MSEVSYDPDDPIVALATPWISSALAVVRTSGPGAIERLAKIFSPAQRLLDAGGGTFVRGRILHPETKQTIDSVVALVYRRPKSYTGQESVELTCHGSLPGLKILLEALKLSGFRDAGPGEFTMRAFLNGKLDLTQAEAVREIVDSKSTKAHSLAIHRLSGSLHQRIQEIKLGALRELAKIELFLDYPEDEINEEPNFDAAEIGRLRRSVIKLLESYHTGRLYQEGARVSIAGRTNSGKSSLFNLFLREDRSIVSDVHGTTRDYLESWVNIHGIPISLFDTAGLRPQSGGAEVAGLFDQAGIEREGIRRSLQLIQSSDLILYLVDATVGLDSSDRRFLDSYTDQLCCVPVWNKVDKTETPAPEGFLPMSAVTGSGFRDLEMVIKNRLVGARDSGGAVLLDSLRQKNLLEQCQKALAEVESGYQTRIPLDAVASDLHGALRCLAEITGEVTSSDILHEIFSRFCVGK